MTNEKDENVINAEDIKKAGKVVNLMQEMSDKRVPEAAQVTKIKINKNEKNATILYCRNGQKSSKEVTFKGYEDAIDDFIIAFRGMSEHIVSTLDFPEEWLPRMTTTGLSITWKDDVIMGMVITAQLEIFGLNAPFNLNTPFIQVASYHRANDGCEDVYFSDECEELLETCIKYAKRYMNGENGEKYEQVPMALGEQ